MGVEQNLFWYGLKGRFVEFLGIILTIFSILSLFFIKWLGVIGIVFGIYIIFKGKAMRFEYKMKSGTIIHRGDW